MFWFIPIIFGATAAAATGTSIANSAMDGALFAPEINTYKEEIRVESSTNSGLVEAINTEADRYQNDVNLFNDIMKQTHKLRETFFVTDSKATKIAMEKILERIPAAQSMPPLEIAKTKELLTLAIGVTGGLQAIQPLAATAAGTPAAARIGQGLTEKVNALKGLAQTTATRAMIAVSSLNGASKAAVIMSPILSAGSKAITIGLQTSQATAQALRAGSAALGPLTAIASVALIGLDVSYSKERANQLREQRDSIHRNNNELRAIQVQNVRNVHRFREDQSALFKAEAQSFRYIAKVLLANFEGDLPTDFPSELNDLDKIERVNSLQLNLVQGLADFLTNHQEKFQEFRSTYHVGAILHWKRLLTSCDIDVRTLLEIEPVLGVMGWDFADYIYRTNFSSGSPDNGASSQTCELDLSKINPIDGPSVQAADLASGRVYHQANQYWIYVDGLHQTHSYRETARDAWSVYLVSRQDSNNTLILDMWRRELIDTSSGQKKAIDTVRAGYLFASPTFEPVTPAPFEYDTDRFGLDYRQVDGLDFVECSKACEADLVCRSFTWAPTASRCYLKDGLPQPEPRPGSSLRSGTKI